MTTRNEMNGAWGHLAAMAVMLIAVSLSFKYAQPPIPEPISVRAITEKDVKEEAQREHRAKAYKNASRKAALVLRRNGCKAEFASLIGSTAVDYGLSPSILASVVYVESSCRATAVSGRDSVGLMQINPKVWKYSRRTLMDPERNLRIGAGILSKYIHRFGLVEGLHAYNGFGNHTEEYSTKVLTAAGLPATITSKG